MIGRSACISLRNTIQNSIYSQFEMMTVVWVDCKIHYFISTAGTAVFGNLQERIRWRQDEEIGPY